MRAGSFGLLLTEPGPAAGALGQAVGARRPATVRRCRSRGSGSPAWWASDRGQVAVAEPARGRGLPEGAVHARAGRAARPARPPRPSWPGSGHSPRRRPRSATTPRPSPSARNCASAAVRGRGVRSSAPSGRGGKCASTIPRGLPGVVLLVAGDLDRAGIADVHDHDLLAVAAHPHRLPGQGVRHRVLAVLERDHRRVRRHRAGHPERGGVGMLGQRVQPGAFLGQHLRRDTAGHPVHPGVDLLAELGARRLAARRSCRSRASRFASRRHQVRLRDLHRVLRRRPCWPGPPAHTWRSSTRSAGRTRASARCAPVSRRHARWSRSSRCRSGSRSAPRQRGAASDRSRPSPTAASYPATPARP